jgi:hypothetical protein
MREISQSDHIATENFCSSTEPEKGQWCKKLLRKTNASLTHKKTVRPSPAFTASYRGHIWCEISADEPQPVLGWHGHCSSWHDANIRVFVY